MAQCGSNVSELEVARSELRTPTLDAMRLVDREQTHVHAAQRFAPPRDQSLGGRIDEFGSRF